MLPAAVSMSVNDGMPLSKIALSSAPFISFAPDILTSALSLIKTVTDTDNIIVATEFAVKFYLLSPTDYDI
jgi:hypothetical protein